MSQTSLNIAFRQVLIGSRANRSIHLCTRLMDVLLTTQPDVFRWGLTESGLFLVKSMYIDYMDNHTKYLHKYLWRIKVPLKIRVFMWFLHKIVFLTTDNLIKRKWQGSEKCCLCDQKESSTSFHSMSFRKNDVAYCAYGLWYNTTNKYKKYVW
jgi:hypothetical protein